VPEAGRQAAVLGGCACTCFSMSHVHRQARNCSSPHLLAFLSRPPRRPQIMFVLVVLSLALCFTALMYLLFHKNESFKEALSFTIVLLVRC